MSWFDISIKVMTDLSAKRVCFLLPNINQFSGSGSNSVASLNHVDLEDKEEKEMMLSEPIADEILPIVLSYEDVNGPRSDMDSGTFKIRYPRFAMKLF